MDAPAFKSIAQFVPKECWFTTYVDGVRINRFLIAIQKESEKTEGEDKKSDEDDPLSTMISGFIPMMLAGAGPGGADLTSALTDLHATGVRSLLVEGGAKVITSVLAEGLADRLIVAVAPTIVGAGTEAIGDLGISTVASGVRLTNRSLHVMADDLLIAWDVARQP